MAANEKGRKASEEYDFLTDTNIVNIILRNRNTYSIHRQLLVKGSPFLRESVDRVDSGGEFDRVVIYPDVSFPAGVPIYIAWLYSGRRAEVDYEPLRSQPVPTAPAALPEKRREPLVDFESLSSLYRLSVELQDAVFQDAVLSTYVARLKEPVDHKYKQVPGARAVNDIYGCTTTGSKATSLLLDFYFAKASCGDTDKEASLYHPNFLSDLAANLLWRRAPTRPVLTECKYHTHAANEACSLSKKRKRE